MQIGEIYTVEIPASEGHEQGGTRPAIIVQAAEFQKLPTVLIVPLTSRLGAQAFPGTLLIQPDANNGLTLNSVALVFQLRAIDKRRLLRRIGQLGIPGLNQLNQLLRALLQLQ